MVNIVLFSSGVSEKNGTLKEITSSLESKGYSCSIWRDLFSTANNADSIALLPMLIKKIPTFDYAVLICEGHDVTAIQRGGVQEKVKTMRDNVLFEIGLCAMALGLNKTILVADEEVRLPEDLTGINGKPALKHILFNSECRNLHDNDNTLNGGKIGEEIDRYIKNSDDTVHQVVIGAASSSACGYVSNFLCRTLEHIDDDIFIEDKKIKTLPRNVFVHVVLPKEETAQEMFFLPHDLIEASVPSARSRPADFKCYFDGDDMHIVDFPTNITTSYDTAKIILEMDADDELDSGAEKRFTAKELKLFEGTLKSVINRHFISEVIMRHYSDFADSEKEKMIEKILDVLENRMTISYYN